MSQSEANLATVFITQSTEARRNRAKAEQAERHETPESSRLYRAVALGQQIQADKAHAILQGLNAIPDFEEKTTSETHTKTMEAIESMVMTAATERQYLIESLLLQIMKAVMSHDAAMQQHGTAAASYHVCMVCGFIARDVVPQRCPVCRAHASQFDTVE